MTAPTAGTDEQAPPKRWFGPLADRPFAYFWWARSLSLIGDYAYRVAFIAYVITATHRSPIALAAANAVLLVPALIFYLVGGVVGDRVSARRRVMITADVARGAVAAVAVVAAATHASVILVVALATAISIGDGFFGPASFAYMSEIVPPDRLLGANSAISVSQQVGLIVGPLLGGFLVGYSGAPYAFAVDALTFLVSALLVWRIRPGGSRARSVPDRSDALATGPVTDPAPTDAVATGPEGATGIRAVIDEIRAGLAYVGVQRWLLISFAVGALANAVFAGNLDVTVPFIVSPGGVHGAQNLGGFYTLEGCGAVLGAVLLARLTVKRPGPLMFRMLALMAASLGFVGLFGSGIGTYVAALAYGVGLHFFNTIFSTALQDKVPDALMSRVSSVAFLGFAGLMPLGTLLMGPLVGAFGPERTVAGTGIVICAVCLWAAFVRAIRELRTAGIDTAGTDAEEAS